jgi:hypothetical protein
MLRKPVTAVCDIDGLGISGCETAGDGGVVNGDDAGKVGGLGVANVHGG